MSVPFARPSLATALQLLSHESVELCEALRHAPDLDAGRRAAHTWLSDRRDRLLAGDEDIHPLDLARARECVELLTSLWSPLNEQRSGVATLGRLQAVLKRDEAACADTDPGFVLEHAALVRGAMGEAGVGRGWLGPVLEARGIEPPIVGRLAGREAGLRRSDFLDELGQEVWDRIDAYPCGLDASLQASRAANRDRILAALGGSGDDWDDPTWQLQHLIHGESALADLDRIGVALTDEDRAAIELSVRERVAFGITPHYLSLFDLGRADRAADGQVRSQVLPPLDYVESMVEHAAERSTYFDFMGEHDTSPAPLITRRYPAIAILKGLDTCPQICVYCQRNWEIEGTMDERGYPPEATLEQALDWFAAHPTVREVLVTGGDPIFHDDATIAHVMERLAAMDHIVSVRWGTRAPVTMPMRITAALAELLGRFVEPGRRAVALVTHVESAAEVTPAMALAVARLRQAGVGVYNQQVFTVQTSRRFQTAANRVALHRAGIDPYYTFYPKGKEETRDYITPLARILQERKEEARLLPGLFRTDEAVFNVPRLGKNHVRASQDRELIGITPEGRRVYLWHPWDKGITDTRPWRYVDMPILGYLERLAELGEDPEDYASIWNYY